MMITGLWLPIVTPFKDGAVDFKSYDRLIEHYLALGVDGLFPLGTTGEAPTLDEAEIDQLVERTVAVVAGRVPVFVGDDVTDEAGFRAVNRLGGTSVRVGPVDGASEAAHRLADIAELRGWLRRSLDAAAAG